MSEALAKAAEVLRAKIEHMVCGHLTICGRDSIEVCRDCRIALLQDTSEELARAVLEATGIVDVLAKLQHILHNPSYGYAVYGETEVMVYNWHDKAVELVDGMLDKLKAALQRAGKEGAKDNG